MEFKQSLGRVSVPRRPAASLVGHSSQADLRMVAAALPHALPSRPSKDVPGRLSLQGPLGPSRLSPQPIPNAREPIFFMGDAEVPGGERAGRMKGHTEEGIRAYIGGGYSAGRLRLSNGGVGLSGGTDDLELRARIAAACFRRTSRSRSLFMGHQPLVWSRSSDAWRCQMDESGSSRTLPTAMGMAGQGNTSPTGLMAMTDLAQAEHRRCGVGNSIDTRGHFRSLRRLAISLSDSTSS